MHQPCANIRLKVYCLLKILLMINYYSNYITAAVIIGIYSFYTADSTYPCPHPNCYSKRILYRDVNAHHTFQHSKPCNLDDATMLRKKIVGQTMMKRIIISSTKLVSKSLWSIYTLRVFRTMNVMQCLFSHFVPYKYIVVGILQYFQLLCFIYYCERLEIV